MEKMGCTLLCWPIVGTLTPALRMKQHREGWATGKFNCVRLGGVEGCATRGISFHYNFTGIEHFTDIRRSACY
jgi:hypothetical protein